MTKSDNPLISIIVPVYNIAKYLERCVNSIIHQSYKNIEIILVDDGSTDGSGQICDAFKEKDPRVGVIHKINGGLSSARNAGLDIIKGEYVGFVDGDDFIDKYMYETLIKAILDNDADIVQTGFKHTDENGNIKDERIFIEATYDNLDDMFYQRFEEKNIHGGVWTKLYKSAIFRNIRFFEGYVFEDFAIMPGLFNECKGFVVIGGAFYNYCSNPKSISKSNVSINTIQSRLETPLYVLKCIENIDEKFIGYAYRYICESCMVGYDKIKKTDKIDKETKNQYTQRLIAQYKKYFRFFKKDALFKNRNIFSKIRLHIFEIAPYLVYLYDEFKRFYKKI
jgi:glycosyltransferase involved in cell wall biosynthesis